MFFFLNMNAHELGHELFMNIFFAQASSGELAPIEGEAV